jgi:molybdenum cofactor cytidylyltransferase
MATYQLGVVILAAGRSRRMGRPKLLLAWENTTVLGHLLTQWQALSPRQIAVVSALDDQPLSAELDRLGVPPANRVPNPAPDRGMFSSVQCAANWDRWREGITHWAIVLGDQPHLRIETLRQIVEFSASHPEKICQPARAGRPRHPVLLPKAAFRELARSHAENLKAFLAAADPALLELDDLGLDLDIDLPEDYQKALEIWNVKRDA